MSDPRIQLLVSDTKNRIYNVPHLGAAGMKGGLFFCPENKEFIKLPPASRFFMLPDRAAVGYDKNTKEFISPGEKYFAVAAFIAPGYTATYNSAYKEIGRPKMLPLYSYAAAGFYKNEFYAAAVKVDGRLCHDPRFININQVQKNAARFIKIFPKNRLIKHLRDCALVHSCPNAQNFFLHRYEGPLPVSPHCNSGCLGCISYQPHGSCPATQPRIKFIPTPQEISEVVLFHISNTKDAVVSFGQGCEGEPLLAASFIEQAIKLIRKKTKKGLININTNASRSDAIARLFDAGLDSMRVSLNSAREKYYTRYYKPRGYTFKDVVKSIKIAKRKGGFVSVNYLTIPGFTDSKDEFAAFKKFLRANHIDMVQWRNLNFDPLRYFRELKFSPDRAELIGIKEVIILLKKEFPRLKMGYFNPAKIPNK